VKASAKLISLAAAAAAAAAPVPVGVSGVNFVAPIVAVVVDCEVSGRVVLRAEEVLPVFGLESADDGSNSALNPVLVGWLVFAECTSRLRDILRLRIGVELSESPPAEEGKRFPVLVWWNELLNMLPLVLLLLAL
jgi:hypothetical protein